MTKKKYQIPEDLEVNVGSWDTNQIANDYSVGITTGAYGAGIFDIDIPIHPAYAKVLSPSINIGDLVESHSGDIGIVVSCEEPNGFFLQIKEANNNYYTVLVDEVEKKYVGYSLKKIKK